LRFINKICLSSSCSVEEQRFFLDEYSLLLSLFRFLSISLAIITSEVFLLDFFKITILYLIFFGNGHDMIEFLIIREKVVLPHSIKFFNRVIELQMQLDIDPLFIHFVLLLLGYNLIFFPWLCFKPKNNYTISTNITSCTFTF
jgi:hypothetical protein